MRSAACALLLAVAAFAHDPVSTKLTWTQEISRIVYKRCAGCHRPGGASPMPLLTYEEARPWAKAIKEQVLHRQMPPWGAVKGFGDFRDDESLTQDEINRMAEWVEGGAPEGEAVYLPPMPKAFRTPSVPLGTRTQRLAGPVRLLGVRPLVSVASAKVVAKMPDGSTVPLIWLRDYKRSWNRTFVYRDPVAIPKGARIESDPPVRLQFLVEAAALRVRAEPQEGPMRETLRPDVSSLEARSPCCARFRSPAPLRIAGSATNQSAKMTSAGRSHSRRRPATRPPVSVSGAGLRIAGASPNSIGAVIVARKQNPASRQSTVAWSNRTVPAGANARNWCSKTTATTNHLTPPRTPSNKPSVDVCHGNRACQRRSPRAPPVRAAELPFAPATGSPN